MPPGVPLARVRAAEEALSKTFKDPDFQARAKSLQLETGAAKSGEQLRDIVARAYAISPQVKARLRAL
jgi:tripartite-type tricarboxylate transporter receptor subunit TctC